MAVTGRHFLLCGAAGEAVPSPEPVAEPLDAASRLVHEVGVRLQSHVSIVYSCVHPACNTMYPPYMCLGAANGILWPWRASAGPPHSLDRCTAGKRSRRLHGHRTPPRSPAASPCWRHTLHYARCGVWCVVCGVCVPYAYAYVHTSSKRSARRQCTPCLTVSPSGCLESKAKHLRVKRQVGEWKPPRDGLGQPVRTTTGLQASTLPRLHLQASKPPGLGMYGSGLYGVAPYTSEAARRDHAALVPEQGVGGELCHAVAREAGLAPWLQCEGAVIVQTEHHLARGGAGV